MYGRKLSRYEEPEQKTARQVADEMRASTSEYVTYGYSDIGIPVRRVDAIADIEAMDDDAIGDGTWYECDEHGNCNHEEMWDDLG